MSVDSNPRISVIGAGSFGTAMAMTLARSGRHVDLFCRTESQAQAIAATRVNASYFPGSELPHQISATSDLEYSLGAEIIFFAFPARNMDDYAHHMANCVRDKTILVNLVKGLHEEFFTAAALFERCVPHAHYVALKGPTFARPLLRADWSGLTCGTSVDLIYERISELFHLAPIHLDHSRSAHATDAISAIKNVYAIVLGLAASIGLSENSLFLLVSMIIKEMRAIMSSLGYGSDALFSYAGLGDTLMTGLCDTSRNRTLGIMIGKEIPIDTTRSNFLAEGVRSVSILHRRVDPTIMPLLNALVDIMEHRSPPVSLLDVIASKSR